MIFIGLDAGSVSVKLAVLSNNGSVQSSFYQRHKGQPLPVALEMLKTVMRDELCVAGNKDRNELCVMGNGFKDKDASRITHHASLSLTGSAGRLIGSVLGIKPINEVVAYAYATRKLYPHIRTIIELGGEDSKLIILGDDSYSAKDFSMNSVCAAGTGSFLDQQAERLRLSIEEFSELSLKSLRPPRIAGRCSVFAKSDMIHLQQIATPVEDIVAGLCFAVARNFKGSIARGRELAFTVSFQGGVAANSGMVRAFKEIFGIDELFVPTEFALMGAIGAAMKDRDEKQRAKSKEQRATNQEQINTFDLQKLEDFIHSSKPSEKGYATLICKGDDFIERHLKDRNELCVMGNGFKDKDASRITHHASLSSDASRITHHASRPLRAWLGVDIGSISTNLAVIDDSCRVIAKRYLMTAGRPIEAVRQGLKEIYQEVGDSIEIEGVGTTGSGRYMIADYIGADIVKNEITAQATAAAFIDREVDTIFEIGGQDSKYISLKNGVVVDFEMNKACAAGTGSFLEEQAEKLGISIKDEFQKSAFASDNPCRLGERCTVFMENSMMSNLQSGTDKKDLLAGLAYSIVQNYINRVVCKRPVGKKIFFQGGVAFNKSVVAAFEKYLGRQIIVPPDHDVTGAIGMALIAMKHMKDRNELCVMGNGSLPPQPPLTNSGPDGAAKGGITGGVDSSLVTHHSSPITAFKGFELSSRSYDISTFKCKGCPNVCEINKIRIEGEKGQLFFGGRCEKYDVRKKIQENKIPDLFAFRNEMLWKAHLKYSTEYGAKSIELKKDRIPTPNTQHRLPVRIGVPYIFYFHDFLPFWTTLLWELGFEVEVSPETDRHIIDSGMETVLAETCFPVKTAHGHIKYLIDKGVDAILIPSFVNLGKTDDSFETGFACPYTQTIPYQAKTAFYGMKALTPVIDLNQGEAFLIKELKHIFKPYNIRTSQIRRALITARNEQGEFIEAIREKGHEIISSLKERAIVIAGRAYNSFDRGVNLDIPKKLAELGVISLPMDFLPVQDSPVYQDWPNMYWRAGQKILSAAKIIRANPLLHAVYIGNFSCGPDSFIIKFFDEEMSGKPYLHLELDAHSADAGAVTRCEAFLDSIENTKGKTGEAVIVTHNKKSNGHFSAGRTIFIPRMSDHAFALAAAFEYCGIAAEVLPESSSETVDIGKKYVSGKECYPCAVTTGDMVKKIMEPGFDPNRSAFFMPSGSGPCRFGQYNVFHRLVIKNLGLDNVPVFSPNQDEHFYKNLKIAGKGFAMRSWEGITAIALLQRCLHQTRPYEKEKNVSDNIYIMHRQKAYDALRGANGGIGAVLKKARIDFENIPRDKDKRPLIGIVGEIFVRSNRFSNEDLARKIEGLGGEAYLTPVLEWIYYINLMALRRVLIKKDWSGMITLLSKRFFQKRIEYKFEQHFAGFLKNLHEPDTREILEKARPYIHPSFEGEAILSIGKSIELIEKGASGIINAMPFGCMPGTIVSGLMRGLKREYATPCLSIPYDGTESLTTEIQLEAFMDQAKEYRK